MVSVCVALLSALPWRKACGCSYRLCTAPAKIFAFYTRIRTHKLQHAHTCSTWSRFGSASKDSSARPCSLIPPYRWIMGSKWRMRARPWACLLLFINGGAEQASILTSLPVWSQAPCAGQVRARGISVRKSRRAPPLLLGWAQVACDCCDLGGKWVRSVQRILLRPIRSSHVRFNFLDSIILAEVSS